MDFLEYQAAARETAIYPRAAAIVYPALGLAGEAGEVADKVKKVIRDGTKPDTHEQIVAELGDVLWYVAVLAWDLGVDLETVAQRNLDKLAARKAKGTLRGSGDKR